MTLVLTVPNGEPGALVELLNTGSNPLRSLAVNTDVPPPRTSPVFIEDYLAAAGGDIRTAIRAAWLANPNATWFIGPPGDYPWVGGALTLSDGYRNGIRMTGQGTRIYRDVAGVATGQIIFFLRSDTGAGHADGIRWDGTWQFDLLNALTSYFGYAIGHVSGSNCFIGHGVKCVCTLDAAATTGRLRWGFALFGGTGADGGGRNNVVDGVTLTLCQIQLCAGPNDVDGVICTNVLSTSNNDYIVSCVSSPGGSVRNVTISNIVGHNVGGSGCVFAGSDGAGTGIGADNVENLTISNVSIDGAKDPDLDFNTASIVLVDLGVRWRNVAISKINTTLASTELQTRSITVASQDDEVSGQGLSISDANLGIVTTNDPLEALFIQGHSINRVQLTNISVEGLRGVRLIDCDQVACSNVNTADGGFLVQAESRNLTRLTFDNCNIKRATGFNTALAFQSAAARSFGDVMLSNMTLQDNNGASGGLFLSTAAAAGTTRIHCANVALVQGTSPPNAATQASVARAVNCPGLPIVTTVVVAVPAVAAGSVGYVIVSMAGTRLANLAINEAVVANPQGQLVVAGAGGGFINARAQAAGAIEFAFVGPLAGGNANFSVARAAA